MSPGYDLTSENDEIYVRFVLKDGKRVWWSTSVNEIHESLTPGNVKGSAVLVFSASHGHAKESGKAEFLYGRRLLLVDGEDDKKSVQETSWSYPEEIDDADGEPSSEEGNLRRKGSSYPASIQKRRKLGSPKGQNPQNHSIKYLHEAYKTVSGRISSLERQMRAASSCSHEELVRSRVNAVRVQVKYELLNLLQRPLKKSKCSSDCPFESIVQRSSMRINLQVDFQLFQLIAKDIFETTGIEETSATVFHPPYVNTQIHSSASDVYFVCFRTAAVLFDWLGVSNKTDMSYILLRHQVWKSGSQLRVAGSMRWGEQDITKPLQIFPGSSCRMYGEDDSNEVSEGQNLDRLSSTAVQFSSSEWDPDNCTLKHHPEVVTVPAEAEACTSTDVEEGSVFSLVWRYNVGCPSSAYSSHTLRSEGVQLGKLEVTIPIVNVYGDNMCKLMSTLLSEKLLKNIL